MGTESEINFFFSMSPDMCCLVSNDGELLKVNEVWEQKMGYPMDYFVGKKFTQFMTPQDALMVMERFQKRIHGGPSNGSTCQHIHANGTPFWVEWRASFSSQFNRMYAIGRDVSLQKKLTEQIASQEKTIRSIIENSEDTFLRFDPQLRHTFASPQVEKYLGKKPEELLGKNHPEAGFSEDLYSSWQKEIQEVLDTGVAKKQIATLDEGTHFFDWHLLPEKDEHGVVESVLSVSREITELVKYKNQLESLTEELKNSNETKDKFFGIVAHDLKSPIASFIQLTALMMDAEYDLSKEQLLSYSKMLHDSSKNLHELLLNLLNWSMIQRELIKMEKQEVVMESVIEKIKLPLVQAAENKHIGLTFITEPHLTMEGDKEMISSILRNLISNAIKFTPTQGQVTVEMKRQESQVSIIVQDSGIGMSESMVSKLFQVGQKINRKGTAGESSSGLGLVITHEFVKLHNGKMTVTSQEGQGTRFEVLI